MSDYAYEMFIEIDVQEGSKTSSRKMMQGEAVMAIELLKKLEKTFGYYWCVEDYNVDEFTKKKYQDVFSDEEFEYLTALIGYDQYGYCNSVEGVKIVPLKNEIIILG